MRRYLTVLLATVSVIVAAESVRAQQAPVPRSGDAKLLAVSSRSVDNRADLDLIALKQGSWGVPFPKAIGRNCYAAYSRSMMRMPAPALPFTYKQTSVRDC
jgi:hypothetical protein